MGVQSGMQVEGLESLDELVSYLRNPNPQVRALGAQVALAVTATEVCWMSMWMWVCRWVCVRRFSSPTTVSTGTRLI